MQKNFLIKIFVSIFSGLILSLSAPGYDLWFIAWFGLIPLFILLSYSQRLMSMAFYSFLFGFSYNLSYLSWLVSLHPITWLGFSLNESIFISLISLIIPALYNALFFILFVICLFLVNKYSPYKKSILHPFLITIIWLIVFNKLSSLSYLHGFPWTLLEYTQYKNLFLIQVSEYLGSSYISFLIVFFNLSLANALKNFFNVEKIGGRYIPRKPVAVSEYFLPIIFVISLLFLSYAAGFYLFFKSSENIPQNSISVLLLQGNLPIKATRGELDIKLARQVYANLISGVPTELLIAPEGALPTIFNEDPNTNWWLRNIAKNDFKNLIFGTYCSEKKEKIFNCALVYSNGEFNFYKKERLVPFGEYIPYYNFLPGFIKKYAYQAIGDGFTSNKDNPPIKTSFGKVGINICFEIIFPDVIRKQVLQGANLLINLSDLSWFNSEMIKKQFLSFAVFRAIENKKPFIITTNSGISAIIKENGEVKDKTKLNVQTILRDRVSPNDKVTFYAKYGW